MNHLNDILEKQWQAQVIELARLHQWRHYHTHRSEKSPSGFPDLVLVRERVIYLELKREKGRLTQHQIDWLRALRDAGQEVYVCRPRHLEALQQALAWKLPKDAIRIRSYNLSMRDHLDELLAA